jgi:hypothetical protein
MKKYDEEPEDTIVINDMPKVYHAVYPTGWSIGHMLDPNEGGLAPKGDVVK